MRLWAGLGRLAARPFSTLVNLLEQIRTTTELFTPTGGTPVVKPSEALALRRTEVLRILDAAAALNPRVFSSVARGDDSNSKPAHSHLFCNETFG